MQKLAPMAVVLGAVAVGANPVFVRLSELTPVASAAHRMIWAIPVFILWSWASARRTQSRPPSGPQPWLLALCGLLFACDLVAMHASIELTTAANTLLFVNAQPIYVVIGGWLLFGTRVSRGFGTGVAIALGGAMLVAWQSLELGTERLLGDGLGVFAGLCYAGFIAVAGRLRDSLSSAQVNLWTCLVGTPILILTALTAGHSLIPESASDWGLMIALGVVSQGLGLGLIVWGLAHLPVSFSSVALLTAPVAAGVFAWWLLGEQLLPLQILGMASVLAGIYVAWRASPA